MRKGCDDTRERWSTMARIAGLVAVLLDGTGRTRRLWLTRRRRMSFGYRGRFRSTPRSVQARYGSTFTSMALFCLGPPSSFTWNSATVSDGGHTISAKAFIATRQRSSGVPRE